MNPSTAHSGPRRSTDDIDAIPHRSEHRDAARADTIDHYPGALREAEKAAQRAHLDGLDAEQAQAASGTVNLLHRYGPSGVDNVVLVPAPTADPQGKPRYREPFRNSLIPAGTDPLNLPRWRRIAVIIMLQICKRSPDQPPLPRLTLCTFP